MKQCLTAFSWLLLYTATNAQLQVAAELHQSSGQPGVQPALDISLVDIRIANAFAQPVRSARAWVFLLDADGKVVGQKAAWLKAGDESAASANEATEGSGFASSSKIPNVRANPNQDLNANPPPAANSTATATATATDPIQPLTIPEQPPLLDAAAENTFRIAVAHERPKEQNPVGTPASVRLVFSRIILADGSSVNPQTGVEELRP